MEYWSRAVLIATWSAAAAAGVVGFWYAGVGGALLGTGCVGALVVFLERYWLAVFVAVYLLSILIFWGAGV